MPVISRVILGGLSSTCGVLRPRAEERPLQTGHVVWPARCGASEKRPACDVLSFHRKPGANSHPVAECAAREFHGSSRNIGWHVTLLHRRLRVGTATAGGQYDENDTVGDASHGENPSYHLHRCAAVFPSRDQQHRPARATLCVTGNNSQNATGDNLPGLSQIDTRCTRNTPVTVMHYTRFLPHPLGSAISSASRPPLLTAIDWPRRLPTNAPVCRA